MWEIRRGEGDELFGEVIRHVGNLCPENASLPNNLCFIWKKLMKGNPVTSKANKLQVEKECDKYAY